MTLLDEIAAERRLELAYAKWGPHPMDWPCPPDRRPPWWRRSERRRLRALEAVFGHLGDASLLMFRTEARKGQSIHEDAGGYLLRCYRAMLGLPVETPYTYAQAVADLIRYRLSRATEEPTDDR